MTRPVDWSPLGLSSDPVPGDPQVVTRAGQRYSQVAREIEQAATKLRRIADGQANLVSEAVDAIRETATTVADDIDRAFERYDETGQALQGFGPQLDDAQQQSLQALHRAQQAQHDIQDAQRKVAHFAAELAGARPEADTATEQGAYRRAQGAVDEANADLAAARRQVDDAAERRDEAAQRAMSQVNEVVEGVDLNDGWYQNWGKDFLDTVATWAGRIGTVLGVLSMFFGWVPFLGWALVGGALLASAVSLGATSIQKAHGDASWTDVALASVGFLTAGVGAVAKVGLKGAVTTAKATAGSARASRTSGALSRAGASSRSRAALQAAQGRQAPRTVRGVLGKIGRDFKSGQAFKTAADDFIGGTNIRASNYARSLQAEFNGVEGADDVLRSAKNLNRWAATGYEANITGQALTIHGTQEDIRKSASAYSEPAKQLNLR